MARTTIREEDITSGAVPTTGIVGTSIFTASGTWTKATRESALGVTIKRVIVEVQGAGGSGNESDNTARDYCPGGAGGYAKKLLDVSSVTSATITVGSGGAGINENVNGNAGGLSSWSDGVNTDVVGNGGSGGSASGSTGGTASGGDINISGGSSTTVYGDKPGCPSFLGTAVANGNAMGYGYGSAPTQTTSTDGGDGIVIVTEIAG